MALPFSLSEYFNRITGERATAPARRIYVNTKRKICETCSGINAEDLIHPPYYKHVSSFLALDQHCFLCSHFEKVFGDRDGQLVLGISWRPNGGSAADGYLKVMVEPRLKAFGSSKPGNTAGHSSEQPWQETNIFILTGIADEAQTSGDLLLGSGVPLVGNLTTTESESSIEKARGWLRHCSANHSCSAKLSGFDDYKPKRLIDLEHLGDDPSYVRLVDGATAESPYATLSYCWGTAVQKILTTTAVLPSYMKSVDPKTTPKTFQQVFEVTKNLGIRYIWIDALCILQDSALEWVEESAKMGAIYSNSWVTISVDWSSDPNSGCYRDTKQNFQHDAESQLMKIMNTSKDGIPRLLYCGENYKADLPEIETAVLATRGWTFQERLLSPRILHYTDKQTYWECRRAVFAEDNIPRSPEMRLLAPSLPAQLQALAENKDPSGLLSLWYNSLISQNYAKRKLSFPTDKLPAISALARLFSSHTNARYLAGLWDHDLPQALIWRVIPGALPTNYCLNNDCPSWSWTSLHANVSWDTMAWAFNGEPRQSFIRIIEAATQLKDEDPFGRVTGGYVRLEGRIKSCHPDTRTHSECSDNPHGLTDASYGMLHSDDGHAMAIPYMDVSVGSVPVTHCLLHSEGGSKSPTLGLGIILGQVSEQPQSYRRLGVCIICSPVNTPLEDVFRECPEMIIDLV
ncbi:hypothetical protein BP6252_10185 [Coleophoma cylindrospora]|uniref:Heterokaryon incompatibility domain-containing protein n=1 Tax=Coleophoma cylindrospora TaxID=1849047 RepID=A0A3D8QXY2_9HELO|nr:hypothetical protein BP6252_10185 [Coleophoma cylindrospora]